MNKNWLLLLMASILILTLAGCTGTAEPQISPPSDSDTDMAQDHDDTDVEDNSAEEVAINAASIYFARCSSCHGADREGSCDAPALLPEVLGEDPSSYVTKITDGSESMPAFENKLSADEINALVEYILSKAE